MLHPVIFTKYICPVFTKNMSQWKHTFDFVSSNKGVCFFLHIRLDAGREDKAGVVPKAIRSFFELAAVVLFEVR